MIDQSLRKVELRSITSKIINYKFSTTRTKSKAQLVLKYNKYFIVQLVLLDLLFHIFFLLLVFVNAGL